MAKGKRRKWPWVVGGVLGLTIAAVVIVGSVLNSLELDGPSLESR